MRTEGAALILSGVKTLISSPFWDYPDGKIPFVGALSVLLEGARRPRGIVETTRVEIMPFQAITEEMAQAYGEGEGTADWWRREMGAFYQASAMRHGEAFTDETSPNLEVVHRRAPPMTAKERELTAVEGDTRENAFATTTIRQCGRALASCSSPAAALLLQPATRPFLVQLATSG